MKKLLALFFIAAMVTTAAGCQNSAKDHNMSAEEHAKM